MSSFAKKVLARRPISPARTQPVNGCRIEDAAGLITDPATGRYPHRTPMVDELLRSLKFAERVWGADTLWTEIEEPDYIRLLRQRIDELVAKNCRAVRAAEITVSRIVTTVGWLRDARHIPRDAAPWPKSWKSECARYWQGKTKSVRPPEPFRPRYTLEEVQKILANTTFDPRLELLAQLGCELRLGQVSRCQRSDLELPPVDWSAPETIDTDYGCLTVHGSGKKGGTIVDLTRGQRKRVDDALAAGYLAPLEARRVAGELSDFALFPSGYMSGRVGFTRGKTIARTLSEKINPLKHVTPSWVRKNWRVAEKRAGIPHITSRCCYGARRQGRDVADVAGLSQSAVENFGGWQPGSDIANKVYRERTNRVGRREARSARALLRGENVA